MSGWSTNQLGSASVSTETVTSVIFSNLKWDVITFERNSSLFLPDKVIYKKWIKPVFSSMLFVGFAATALLCLLSHFCTMSEDALSSVCGVWQWACGMFVLLHVLLLGYVTYSCCLIGCSLNCQWYLKVEMNWILAAVLSDTLRGVVHQGQCFT